MDVGALRITPIVDGSMDVPPQFLFPTTTEQDWEPHRSLLTASGLLPLPVGGFLVQTDERVMLVDAGVGLPSSSPDFGHLLEHLALAGVTPEAITDVVFTHLHFDHVGWATNEDAPVFVNATYRAHAADLEYFDDPQLDDYQTGKLMGAVLSPRERLAPVRDRIVPFDGDVTLAPGVDIRSAPGHTPGSAVVVLSSGLDRALLLGDVVHCPVELVDDEWAAIGDVDPVLARRTRELWSAEAAGERTITAAPHFPGMEMGRLLGGTGTRRWIFT